MAYNYDPESTDEDFEVIDRAVVFMEDQVVSLSRAAYADSIVVNTVDSEWGVLTTLVLDTDYTLGSVDQDATSLAKSTSDDPFTETLVSSITIIAAWAADYPITVSYVALETAIDSDDAALIALQQDVNFLEAVNSPMTNVTADLLDPIQLLDEDLTGMDEDNFVEDEEHYVTAATGKCIIKPANGPFYHHNLVVKNPSDVVLTEGVDYVCVGMDVGRTRATYHTSQVYYCIWITASITGTVKVTYQAYGGDLTHADGDAFKDVLASILMYITTNQFLTAESLEEASIITDLTDRMGDLEDRLNYMWATIMGGVKSNFTLTAADTDYHWIPFATLYQDSLDALVEDSSGIFRIYGVTNLDLDFTFRVRFDKNSEKVLTSRTVHGTNPVVIQPGYDYTKIPNQLIPKIRVIYGTGDTGIQLQLALPVTHVSGSAEILVENRSTPESEWELIDTTAYTHGDNDDNVLLPDETTTWTAASNEQYIRALAYKDGVVIFGGAAELVSDNALIYGPFEAGVVPASDVSGIEVGVYDRYTNSFVTGIGRFHKITDGYKTIVDEPIEGVAMFDLTDLCGVQVSIDGGAADDDPVEITVVPYIGSFSQGTDITDEIHLHRYQLNHIKLLYAGDQLGSTTTPEAATIFVTCEDHTVLATGGSPELTEDEVISKVIGWSIGTSAVTVATEDVYTVETANITGGLTAFIESFYSYYYYDDGTPTLAKMPSTAHAIPDTETRNLSGDSRIDTRDEDLQLALKRAAESTIFGTL